MGRFRSGRPPSGAVRGVDDVLSRGGIWRAFVERHDDVRTEPHLDLNRALRRDLELCPVEMTAEHDTAFRPLPERREAHDLIPAAIGEEWFAETREAVQTTQSLNDILAWPHVQVIRVREDDLRADLGQLVDRESFHRARGPHGHEDRRSDFAVWGTKQAGARASIAGFNREVVGFRKTHVNARPMSIRTRAVGIFVERGIRKGLSRPRLIAVVGGP